ncbi:MAG: acetoacetate--CoA ligase [Cyclobacteriaceae bacterium]
MLHPTPEVLWTPSQSFVEKSNLKKYERWLSEEKSLHFSSYQELWKWSVEHVGEFWESIWEYFEIINHSDRYKAVLSGEMPRTKWFEGAKLNYAQHVFRKRSSERPALIFKPEGKPHIEISWDQLERDVAAFRSFLLSSGITKGDCVAGFLPNIPETIVAFLATNSIGAIWSCCSPDFGVSTVIDRFAQIEPKLLIATDGYVYNGKKHSRLEEIKEIQKLIPSIRNTVLIPYIEEYTDKSSLPNSYLWQEALLQKTSALEFEPVEFDHPIWVLYSSGTTGKPKAITHSHGGVLLEHLKYMHFHNDVKPGENFFWFTTTGWMMWNFLQASLLAGATAVLFDGSPGYNGLNLLWDFAAKLPIHHFGTSAPFLTACMKAELEPKTEGDLTRLRSIGSTGAPLPPEAFDWVYKSVSKDVWLCSMSGGTDVCTAFVGGVPYAPVLKGNIQGRALGCSLNAIGDEGKPVINSLGEMVIDKPMPSMPIYFWNDLDYKRYTESYFEKFEGSWCHGDWIKVFEDGSLIIQGRSDATLNRKGIRIGTAEIYSVLNKIEGIKDSLIVNLELENGEDFMPLFIVKNDASDLEALSATIRSTLKSECSPRHVPDKIIEVSDLPYTLSGKKMEVPVKKVLMGMKDAKGINEESIRNPDAMRYFNALDVLQLINS